MAYIYILAGAV